MASPGDRLLHSVRRDLGRIIPTQEDATSIAFSSTMLIFSRISAKSSMVNFSKIVHFCVPIISRILIMFKIHSRIINQLNKLRSESHKTDNHSNLVSKLLGEKKILALDVGAQGGFFNDSIFSRKYSRTADPYFVDTDLSTLVFLLSY